MTHDKLTRETFLQIFSGGGGRFWAAWRCFNMFQQRLVKKKRGAQFSIWKIAQ